MPLCSILARIARDFLIFLKLVEAVTAMNFYWVIYTVEEDPNVPIFNGDIKQ